MTCTPEYLRTTVMISEKLTAEQHNIKSSDELFFATAAVDRYRISADKEHGGPSTHHAAGHPRPRPCAPSV